MAGFSRTNTDVYWWSLDALLRPDELFEALSQVPSLTISDRGPISEGDTRRVNLEAYVATYAKYVDGLTDGRPFADARHTKFYASMSLDASVIENPPRAEHPALRGFGYCPVLLASSLEMVYERESNRISVGGHGRPNPIHFGISFAHPNVWNVALADIPPSDIRNWFPNVELMAGLTDWVKRHSEPCKVTLPGREQVLPVRLGRQARHWVNEHTGLARLGISVRTSRPVKADPSWLTPSVLNLASVIRDESDFAALPILSDALEESGCSDEMILRHCRGQRDHVWSCWVVDMLLANR